MSAPHRLHDWQLRWEAFVLARRSAPFAWGANDCCTFAADAVQAIIGVDVAPAGLREHRTAKQAYRALRRHGGIASIATKALGDPISPGLANVGDVLLVVQTKHPALAVCNGDHALAPSASGLEAVPLSCAVHAWRVG